MPTLGDHARSGLGWPARRAVDAAGLSLGGLFGALSLARRAKSAHPRGTTFDAELVVERAHPRLAGSTLLEHAATWPAVVRVSRTVGLPRPWPDVFGLAVRVPEAYGAGRPQDLLFLSSAEGRLARRLLLPGLDVLARPFSSGVPFTAGGRELWLAARPVPAAPQPVGETDRAHLLDLLDRGGLDFGLAVAAPDGDFEPFGLLRLTRQRSGEELEALRFNPFNTGGGLAPSGLLNRMRDYAYPLSQQAWGRTRAAADAQATADAAAEAAGRG